MWFASGQAACLGIRCFCRRESGSKRFGSLKSGSRRRKAETWPSSYSVPGLTFLHATCRFVRTQGGPMDIILNNIEELTTPVLGFVMKNEAMATSKSTVQNEAMATAESKGASEPIVIKRRTVRQLGISMRWKAKQSISCERWRPNAPIRLYCFPVERIPSSCCDWLKKLFVQDVFRFP